MKKLLLLSCFCSIISFCAFSQVTYLADTAFTTDLGYDGAPASCRAIHERYLGFNMNRVYDQWSADVFTVPAGATWIFDTVILYGAQYESGITSTFHNCNLQIYDGTPGLGGSVIWGDTSTNVLINTGFTGIYKVDTISSNGGLLDANYPIMYLQLYLSPAPVLSAGTYWLAWSAACSGSYNPFSVDKVLPGRINPSGQMGRGQYDGSWQYDVDSDKVVGFNMIIKAKAGLAAVPVLNNQTNVALNQNVPNPFTGSTNISFYLSQDEQAKLSVYNVIAQTVTTLADGYITAGEHQVAFDASNLPPGIYYYRLSTNTGAESKAMLLVR